MRVPKPSSRKALQSSVTILRELQAGSNAVTPASSRWPSADNSAYATEDEEVVVIKGRPFPFLDLPSELRNKIYGYMFETAPQVIDLDPDNFRQIHRKLSIFLVSRQVHAEVAHAFYSTHTVRLFPCHPGRFFKSKKPLLARLPSRYRGSISSFELRLGPGFAAPPRGWVINEALGLADCTSVRILEVMVQVDPSNPIFKGFRKGDDDFYETFSQDLLEGVLKEVPSIVEVQFDAWASVQRNGPMMYGLLEVARRYKKMISWGPERGWKEEVNAEWTDAILASSIGDLTLSEVPVIA